MSEIKTLHEDLIDELVKTGASRKGYWKAMTSAWNRSNPPPIKCSKNCECDDCSCSVITFKDVMESYRRPIPDAWVQVQEPGNVHWSEFVLYEVVDTHVLSADKLSTYAELWFGCDYERISLRLIRVDARTSKMEEIDLCKLWQLFNTLSNPFINAMSQTRLTTRQIWKGYYMEHDDTTTGYDVVEYVIGTCKPRPPVFV